MVDNADLTNNYFSCPENYFWKWDDNGEVITTIEGETICYREDLVMILNRLEPVGFPHLGTILFILLASKNKDIDIFFKSASFKNFTRKSKVPQSIGWKAVEMLKAINQLSPSLRTSHARAHLIQELSKRFSKNIPTQSCAFILDAFKSGQHDHVFFIKKAGGLKIEAEEDFKNLAAAFDYFENEEKLALLLRTGLDQIVEKVDFKVEQEPVQENIFQILDKDNKTARFSRLAKHLIASMAVPVKLSQSAEQLYGGISDISNRGNYDKLLLSELAHDADTFMARIVNNEALYLRKEAPPSRADMMRCVLIDTTIKMWGTPKVFAIAAALANSQQKGTVVTAFGIGGHDIIPLDLGTKAGVIKGLELQNPYLDCSSAFEKIDQLKTFTTAEELLFVTSETHLDEVSEDPFLAKILMKINYLITVSRGGNLKLFQVTEGRKKLVKKLKFDLDELLHKPLKDGLKRRGESIEFDFLDNEFPLLFPSCRIDFKQLYGNHARGVIGVNEQQRLLLWRNSSKGAIELIQRIEEGKYSFNFIEGQFYVSVCNRYMKIAKLYQFDELGEYIKEEDLNKSHVHIYNIFMVDNFYYLEKNNAFLKINLLNQGGPVVKVPPQEYSDKLAAHDFSAINYKSNNKDVIRMTNVMHRCEKLAVSLENQLVFNNKKLIITEDQSYLKWKATHDAVLFSADVVKVDFEYSYNKKLLFKKFMWNEGSYAIIDPRGFLHLKSAADIPDVIIPLVIGKVTAAWSSDGTVTGSDYFYNNNAYDFMAVPNFCEKYILPFIEQIKENS